MRISPPPRKDTPSPSSPAFLRLMPSFPGGFSDRGPTSSWWIPNRHTKWSCRHARRELPENPLGVDRIGAVHRPPLENFPRILHPLLDLLSPRHCPASDQPHHHWSPNAVGVL